MDITFTHTPDDLLAYNWYFQRVSAVGRSRRRTGLAILIAAGVLMTALVYTRHGNGMALWIVAILSAALIALAPWMQKAVIRRTIRRHLADPRFKGSFGDYRVTATRDGLHSISPVAETDLKWANVGELVYDGDDHFYLCLASGAAMVISRRSYRGPVHFDQLKGELERLRDAC